jgi:hypothetical protein
MSVEAREGKVVAVCTSEKHGYPTYPQDIVSIGLLGIPDDAHSGELRESFREPGTFKPNDRPICIVAKEVQEEMQMLGYDMHHGDFNEQMVVEGLGDLGDIPVGTLITFDNGLMLEVVDHAYPCTKLEDYKGKGLIKALAERKEDGSVYSKRGILCKVIQPDELKPGTTIRIWKQYAAA